MMNRKVTYAMTAALAVSLFTAGCNQAASTSTSSVKTAAARTSSQSITFDLVSEPPNLNPANCNDGTSGWVLGTTMEGLTYTGKDAKPKPGIAKSWTTSKDGKVWTFKLRDAKWSNGDPVTAEDFVWEWKHVLDPKTGTQFANYLYYIKGGEAYNSGKGSANAVGVKALDAHTLQVTLNTPVPYFLDMLSFWSFYPVDSKVAQKNPKWATDASTFVSNGPFVLKSWQHQQQLVMEKSPTYWNKGAIQLQTITGVMVSDPNTMYQMYRSGQLDMDLAPPLDMVPQLIKNKEATVLPTTGTYYLLTNTKKAPFNNANIRKALALAMNRASITQDVVQAGQQPAYAFVPPHVPGVNGVDFRKQGGNYIKESVNQAKAYLAKGLKELGLKQLPTITYKYNTLETNQKVAEALQQMWQQNLGIKVNLQQEDWKVYLDDLAKGNFDIGRMGWIDTWIDPSNTLDLLKSDFGSNYTKWKNSKYDALVNDAEMNLNVKKRNAEMHQAEQMMLSDMPVIPVYYYANVLLFNKRLGGIVVQPNNSSPDFRFMSAK